MNIRPIPALLLISACGGPTLEPDCGVSARLCGSKGLYDYDGDGYCEDVDCDEDDCDVHPKAPERCNNKDDDCNGAIDAADPGLVVVDDAHEHRADFDRDGWCGGRLELICDVTYNVAASSNEYELSDPDDGRKYVVCPDGTSDFEDCCDLGTEDACGDGTVPPKCIYPLPPDNYAECGVDPECNYAAK